MKTMPDMLIHFYSYKYLLVIIVHLIICMHVKCACVCSGMLSSVPTERKMSFSIGLHHVSLDSVCETGAHRFV